MKAEDKSACMEFRMRVLFLVVDVFSLYSHVAEKELVSSLESLLKATNPAHEDSALLTYLALKDPVTCYWHMGG